MDCSFRVKVDFGAGEPAHYDVDFTLGPHPVDGSPQVGLQAVKTMAGAVLGTVAQPYEDQIKAEAIKFAKDNGLWPIGDSNEPKND